MAARDALDEFPPVTTLTIETEVARNLAEAARRQGMPPSELIAAALAKFLATHALGPDGNA